MKMAGAAARGVGAGGYSTLAGVEEVEEEEEEPAALALSASRNVDDIFTPPLPTLPPTPLTAALLLLTATRHSASEAYLPLRESAAALPSARHQSRTSAHCAS